MRTKKPLLAILLLVALPAIGRAQELPQSFSLGKYIPDGWWMYIHYVDNPERKWIDEQWAEVWDALKASGIDKDVLGLVFGMMNEQQKGQTEAALAKAQELLGKVCWSDLVAKEVVISERIGPPVPDYVFLARGADGSGEANAKGLASILEYIASIVPVIHVVPEKIREIDVWSVNLDGQKYTVHLIRRGDVVGIVTNRQTLGTITDLMDGKSTTPSLVDSPRFKTALQNVKKPEDGVLFFDYRGLLRGVNSLVTDACKEGKSDNDEESAAWSKIFNSAFALVDVVDYQVMSVETDGRQEFTHLFFQIQADKMNTPLAKTFLDRKPFNPFDKYVPAEALSFSMNTSVDLGGLYRTVLSFVADTGSEGKEGIDELKQMMAAVGFDPERDIFSWLGGEMIQVDLPSTTISPFGSTPDSVMMIRVKDAKVATQKIDAVLAWIKDIVAKEAPQFALLMTPKTIGSIEGFQEVAAGPMAMFVRPVVGVADEWLIIGSTADAVGKCLDVASGKSPSIRKNDRFAKEGLVPKGPVLASSFSDTSKSAQEMAAGLGMASMIGGMVAQGIPSDNPEAAKGKALIQSLFGVMMKLGPVVQKIDFYSSESSMTVQEGTTVRSEIVVTYKSPTAETKSADAAGSRP
ncbi:MAG: hypothetical protein AABZ47_00065 [Planctomycetota bacterium]